MGHLSTLDRLTFLFSFYSIYSFSNSTEMSGDWRGPLYLGTAKEPRIGPHISVILVLKQESSRLVVRIIKIKMVIIDNDKHNDKGKADDN